MHMSNVTERILGFEKGFKGYVIDPLHGQIGLTDIEEQVIITQAFKRLKNIHQLGFASSVYPGASHKRYEHCIGTLHVTWTMIKKFLANYPQQKTWEDKSQLKCFSDDILQSLRLAALLHDVGHGPFSHTYEQVSSSRGKKIDHDKVSGYLLTSDLDQFVGHLIPDKEALALIQDSRLEDFRKELGIIPKERREQVIGIFEKNLSMPNQSEDFAYLRLFLHDILKGDIGSDRIDYLLRDTYFSGLGHRFNFSDLLNNLRGINDPILKRLLLAVDFDGKSIVEFIMMTRYYHYRLIAHHPVNILEETKFRERLQKEFEEKTLSFFNSAADNDGIERDIQPFSDKIELVGSWNLGSIWYDHLRFFFYRISSDSILKKEYIERIKANIVAGVEKHQHTKISTDDLFVEISLESPHIPLMNIFKEKYRIEKDQDVEKYSILLHDHSVLLRSLAKTYVEDSTIFVFSKKAALKAVKEYTSSTHHFFVDTTLFTDIMSKTDSMSSRLDFLLYCLHDATELGVKNFRGIFLLFKRIEKLQEKMGFTFYDFGTQDFYDPETKGTFCYPVVKDKEEKTLIDDLFIMEACGLIEIRSPLVNQPDKFAITKQYHSSTYIFTPTVRDEDEGLKGKMIPLKSTLKMYSKDFKNKYDLTDDILTIKKE